MTNNDLMSLNFAIHFQGDFALISIKLFILEQGKQRKFTK